MEETYTHGHQEPVLRSHRWRTAENSAAYLLPHLAPGLDVLDVGCGPGTITAGLAARVAPGRVIGVDREPDVIAEARGACGATVEFQAADVYRLPFANRSFDVVHAHQVLQHLADPVGALTEMGRVLRPDGRLAVRDADYGAFIWHPADGRLDRWREIYTAVCSRNGADANAGRALASWVRAAGFSAVAVSSSTWTFAGDEARWWAGTWAERTMASSFAEQALDYGLSTRGELAAIAEGWREWSGDPSPVFVVLHVEVIGRP
jgi:SAM-dependent methyltransferase